MLDEDVPHTNTPVVALDSTKFVPIGTHRQYPASSNIKPLHLPGHSPNSASYSSKLLRVSNMT